MSSKTETKSTNTYNQASMGNYNAFQGSLRSGLDDYVNNPGKLQNAWMQQANTQIGQLTNRQNNNLFSNFNSGGWGGGNLDAYRMAQVNRNSRAAGSMQSNAFLNTLFQADDRKRWALGQMQGYQPLQTGGTQTQTKSGVGTWLPQLAGAAIGGASAFFSGGATKAFGGLGGGGISSLFGGPSSAATIPSPNNSEWITPNAGGF